MNLGYDGLPMEVGWVRQGIHTEIFVGKHLGKHPTGRPRRDGRITLKWNLERQAVKMGGEQNWFKVIFNNSLMLPTELSGSATSY
jgi:hypothetical protein